MESFCNTAKVTFDYVLQPKSIHFFPQKKKKKSWPQTFEQ